MCGLLPAARHLYTDRNQFHNAPERPDSWLLGSPLVKPQRGNLARGVLGWSGCRSISTLRRCVCRPGIGKGCGSDGGRGHGRSLRLMLDPGVGSADSIRASTIAFERWQRGIRLLGPGLASGFLSQRGVRGATGTAGTAGRKAYWQMADGREKQEVLPASHSISRDGRNTTRGRVGVGSMRETQAFGPTSARRHVIGPAQHSHTA
jgi:hypothetical protein